MCGRLCSGHNEQSRNFLREQDRSVRSVDIVQDIATAQVCLMELLTSHFKYITYDAFTEKLAPNIWPALTLSKRRFIAWHDKRVDYCGMCKLMLAVNIGFEVLKVSSSPDT